MDEYPGRKSSNGGGVNRKGSSLTLRVGNHESRSSPCCNRLGCSTRLNPINESQNSFPQKPKPSKPHVGASSSNAVTGSSSRLISSPTGFRRADRQPQSPAIMEIDLASSRNGQGFLELPVSTAMDDQAAAMQREELDSTSAAGSCASLKDTVADDGNGPSTSGSRLQKRVYRKENSGKRSLLHGSSSKEAISGHSISSRNSREHSKTFSSSPEPSSSRYRLGNLGCTSISDVLPSRFSVTDARESSRFSKSIRNERTDGENSTVRGKSISGTSTMTTSNSRRGILSRNMSCTSNSPSAQATRSSGCSTVGGGVRSVRARRTSSGNSNLRLSDDRSTTSRISLPVTSMLPPQSHLELSNTASSSGSSSPLSSIELPTFCLNSFGRLESDENSQVGPSTHHEGSSDQGLYGLSLDHGGHFNVEGIAEVLFALERIGQDEELTYEQLLVLETNLLLGGLNFYDQHRDMRLDIDNMTYEELLALEERMGSVSTALSEEALSKCLRRSFYSSDPTATGISGPGDDDSKCIICQEEYADEEEVGHLHCGHRYHVSCIHVWLRLKNWCPICKAPAASQ